MIRADLAARAAAVDAVMGDPADPAVFDEGLAVVSLVALHGRLYRRLRARGVGPEEAAAQAAEMAAEAMR